MDNPHIRITLFGSLEIVHAGQAPQRPPTQRALALLGYLVAHHNVPQGRDKLVDALWPDLPPRQGRRMLSDTLWRVRRMLAAPGQPDPPSVLLAGDTVAFRPDPGMWVDTLAFEQLLQPHPQAEPDPEQARAAAELYRGDFLEDCYDDWALYERERLRERYLGALQQLLAYDMGRQAYDQALQCALRLVRADPLREEGHRALMRIYYLLGRTADALRAFEQCRRALQAELGLEPEPATLSLYEEIAALQQRRGGTLPAPAAPHGFAITNDTPFVGRQAARAEVMEAVEQALVGAGGLMLVAGLAGQGKTRLLREVSAGAEWRGAQVSWGAGREGAEAQPFGPLSHALNAALTPARARQLAELLPAPTLGALLPLLPNLAELLPDLALLPAPAGQHQVSSLHAAISSLLIALGRLAPQLLVLEDLHWFDAATLEALAVVAPRLRDARVLLLLSGRADEIQQRPLIWQTLLQFDRAGLLRRTELRGLSADECADLVRRALKMHQPAPRFSARLAATTGGNPFFILETLRALHEQGKLTRDAQGVWHTAWDDPAGDYHELELPAGLHQAIDVRLRELPAAERATLAAAAVLGQNFAPTTLARMANGAPPPELLRRQFLVEDGAGYRFGHDTLREVIYGELDEPTRRELHLRAAEALELEHYARAEALAQHLYLAGAWEKALPHLQQAGDHAYAMRAYRDALRNYDQAREALAHLPERVSGPATRYRIELRRADLATLLGEYSNAILAYESVLRQIKRDAAAPDASTRVGARRSAQIQALNGLCCVAGLTNDYGLAQRAGQRAITLAASSPQPGQRAEALYQWGVVCLRRDDYAEALELLDQARALYESVGDEPGMARCWYRLAWATLRTQGATDGALALLERARAAFEQQGAQYEQHDCTIALGNLLLWRGALPEAIRLLESSLPFFRASTTRDKVSEAQIARAEALRRIGRYDDALAAAQEVYQIHTELGRAAAAQYAAIVLGNVLRGQGRYDEARVWIELACGSEERLIRARGLFVLAELSLHAGALPCAFGQATEALATVRQLKAQAQLGVALRLLGQVRAADWAGALPPASDDLPAAEECFAQSIGLLREARYESDLGLAYALQGAFLLASGRAAEARAALRQAEALAQRCGMAELLAQVQADTHRAAELPAAPAPGQLRVRLARQGTPRGRPLRDDELADVLWTIASAEDEAVRAEAGKVAERQARLRRLCDEALAQGAEPTVGDLAGALGVNGRTIDRDIAALRAAGALIVTRGAVG